MYMFAEAGGLDSARIEGRTTTQHKRNHATNGTIDEDAMSAWVHAEDDADVIESDLIDDFDAKCLAGVCRGGGGGGGRSRACFAC